MALSNQTPATNFTLTLGRDSWGAPFPTKWSLNKDGKNLQRPPNIRFSVLLGGQHHDSERNMKLLVFPSEWWGFFTYTTTTTITITITADYPQTTPPKGAALNDAWDSVYWLAFDGILIYSGFWHNHPYITGYDFIPNIQQRTTGFGHCSVENDQTQKMVKNVN